MVFKPVDIAKSDSGRRVVVGVLDLDAEPAAAQDRRLGIRPTFLWWEGGYASAFFFLQDSREPLPLRLFFGLALCLCRIDLTTSFRWRHRFLKAAQDKKARAVTGMVEADETFFLRSEKGSRKIVCRAPRKRGGVARKRGLSDEQVPVLIVRDRSKATTDEILPDLKGETIAGALRPIVARDALLVSDGAEGGPYRAFANREGILHVGLNMGAGQHRWGVYHIQNVNAYASGLKSWMRRFRGVATKHLPSYLGWRRLMDREGERLTAHFCIAVAAVPMPRST